MYKISIVMPVYNASKYLEMSLNSIIEQTLDSFEIIVVDDGSTDNSKAILDNYRKEHDYIKVFYQENAGPGVARNNALKHVNGEYIAFLDADDKFLDKSALERMYNFAKQNNADMLAANLKRITETGEIEKDYDFTTTLFTYFDRQDEIKPAEYGIPWAFYKNIYKTSFIKDNNCCFPPISKGEDPIFLANILTSIDKIYVMDIDFYGYNHSASGGVNLKLDDYDKKRQYIQHFIDVFNILGLDEFTHVKQLYKKEFIDFLNFRQNYENKDIKSIVRELFKNNEYFDEDDYGYLLLDLIKNGYSSENDIGEYNLIKYCLFEESMLENAFIDVERLQCYTDVSKDSDNNKLKSSLNQLKHIESYTFEEKRRVSGNVGRIKKEIKHYIKSNDEILNSNSWKLTSYLRSIKQNL